MLNVYPHTSPPSLASSLAHNPLDLRRSLHVDNMRIQPIPLQFRIRHILRPTNPPFTHPVTSSTTHTLERLSHFPLCTRVEEAQDIPLLQGPVVHDPHFHGVHVEDQRRRARVVNKHQVGVELDVCAAAGLHRRVGFRARRGSGDFGKQAAGWQ